MGSLARALEGFFTARGLALPTDQDERLAAGRRRRRIDAVPGPLRPAAESFAAFMLRARERALRAGTLPREDETRMLRSTRLIDLVNTMDPKLVAAVFGMDAESVIIYLADHVGDSYLQACPRTRKVR